MDDLMAWLRERLVEDADVDADMIRQVAQLRDYAAENGLPRAAVFLDQFGPARMQREVEAKLLLFVLASVLMTPIPTPEGYPERARKLKVEVELAEEQAADKVMRLLALPCADRPGYREEWRP
jgi:hypothetical protein